MVNRVTQSQRRRLVTGAVAAALFVSVTAAPAAAQQRRARLSADLADHLSAGSQSIDVIVHGDQATVDAIAARYNVPVKRHMASGAVLKLTAGQLSALQQDETIDHLSGDIASHSSDAVTAESIGADQVWAGAGSLPALSGKGVAVAVIDSGIDATHNAFAHTNRILVTKDFTGGDGKDRYGHGTHVAAIIAGAMGKTADTREYRGIASGAYLLNLRVLGADGSGTASSVIEAIDWTIAHKDQYNVRIINLSLGAPVLQPYRDDPLCEAVERAVHAGITVVVAAGNYGRTANGTPVFGSIASPGNSPHAIAVGAIDAHGTPERSDDTLATYSSKGPTRYDLIMKPDVSAPGSHIASAESADSYLSKMYPERHVAGSGANAYMQLSGTSQAAAVVSGAAALVLDARPGLTPGDTRAALQLSSTFLPSAGFIGAGAGEINVAAAVELARSNQLNTTSIAGEDVVASGLFTPSSKVWAQMDLSSSTIDGDKRLISLTRKQSNDIIRDDSILWGATVQSDSIVWDGPMVWGASIVWDSPMVWGASIVWDSPMVWGASIVWDGPMVWGASIVWDSPMVWGDSIVWDGPMIWGDSIVWD
jgi:serine protease AprX